MRWSWKLAEVAGIGIYVHWTFLILLGWFAVQFAAAGQGAAAVVTGLLFILALFGCVVLHELGHALTAKRYGVRTRDITLLPIGGIARLERMPEEPRQEFWIAVAGPAVNVVIALVLLGVLSLLGPLRESLKLDFGGSLLTFLGGLLLANAALVVFNMIPAFPMDGGRVLRALLATQMPYLRATQIAATVGQGIAILFGIFGLLAGHWVLLFVAIFVYIGAQEEAHMAQFRSAFQGVPVRAVMVTRFRALEPDDTLEVAVKELIAGTQTDFPVLENEHVAGMLTREAAVEAVSSGGLDQRVGDAMSRDCGAVEDTEMLIDVLPKMQAASCTALPVLHKQQLVGLLTQENIGEWAMIQSALRTHVASPPAAAPPRVGAGT